MPSDCEEPIGCAFSVAFPYVCPRIPLPSQLSASPSSLACCTIQRLRAYPSHSSTPATPSALDTPALCINLASSVRLLLIFPSPAAYSASPSNKEQVLPPCCDGTSPNASPSNFLFSSKDIRPRHAFNAASFILPLQQRMSRCPIPSRQLLPSAVRRRAYLSTQQKGRSNKTCLNNHNHNSCPHTDRHRR